MTHDGSPEDTARRRLRTLRQARGWTIDELARRSTIGPSTVSRLETGRRRLAVDHLAILARRSTPPSTSCWSTTRTTMS